MKKLLLILSFFYSASATAQLYNNEWIDYSKTYYKFKVGRTGLYRIPQSVLTGIPALAAADVSHFQLWRNGQEVPVYTSNNSGVLAAGGYIEFWGEANDGRADQPLYKNAADQINASKSLFTDTAAYFLTINPGIANRRLVTTANTIPTDATPEPYFIHTAGIYPNETIHLGPYAGAVSEAAISASFEVGEGWTSSEISETNKTRSFQLTNLFPYTGSGAPGARVSLNVVGNSPNSRTVIMQLNNTQVFSHLLSQFTYAKLSTSVPIGTMSGSTENITVTNETTVSNNRIKIGQIEIAYPRLFNFGGASSFRLSVAAGATGKYLEISGFNYSGTPVLYDMANGRRYMADVSNPSLVKVYLQPGDETYDLVLVSQATTNINTIASLEPRNFINYQSTANQGDYLIITHNNILNGPNGSNPVEEYRAYRSSAVGGGYNARVYMIDQLTDQFAYGIKGSPLSVRNFLRSARAKFANPPRATFIIGKGVKYVSARMNESNPILDRLNLVPTFGEPASDILLAAEGVSSVPLTPIGRVAVVNGNELAVYLEKVKQYEAHLTPAPGVEASAWKKNVIHMVGANEQGLSDQLYSYLNRDKLIIGDTLFGAKTTDFVNSSSPEVRMILAAQLRDILNGGANLLTYFGHSSSTSLAFNLENPNNYSNHGKYPVFHMMGCNVGDIFIFDQNRLSTINTISDKYMLAAERGSIGMMAGTSFGYVDPLQRYNNELYKLLSKEGYRLSLGELMQKTIINTFEKVGGETSSGLFIRAQNEEYTLNGDPAIRLYQFDKPDYAIEDFMVSVEPGIVSVADARFTLKARIANVGKATNDPVVIELKRTFPDMSVELIRRDTINTLYNADSLTYQIEIQDPAIERGANKFNIIIDPQNSIDELFETNNTVTKEVFIYEDDLKPVYPLNYAIVNKQNIVLAASTGNPFSASGNYMMELDTTKQFSSSSRISQTKTSTGGLIEFSPGLTFKDSTVYYWRVGKVPTSSSEQILWSTSSFTYIPGSSPGFSQSHFQQFADGLSEGINIDNEFRGFAYDSTNGSVTVNNAFFNAPVSSIFDVRLQLSGVGVQGGFIVNEEGSSSPQTNSLRFYLVDNQTFKVVQNEDLGTSGRYGSFRPLPWGPTVAWVPTFFQFDISTTEARKKVMTFLDSIPSGYYVGVASNQIGSTILPAVWQSDTATLGKNNSLYHKLKLAGLTKLDSITSVIPYAFVYQKDNPGLTAAQTIASSPTDKIEATLKVPVSSIEGSFTSPVFTKAASWDKFTWEGYSLEQPSTDSTSFSVIGIDKNGTATPLIENIPASQKTVDLSSVDAATYTGLKIRMQSRDEASRSAYQVRYWRLYSTPAPEGAVAPNLYFSSKDTLEAGEPAVLGLAFKNLSDQPFDSLSVKLAVRNQNNVETVFTVPKLKPLAAGDTVKLTIPIDTRSLTGNNIVHLEFNPEGQQHQPEQFQFNNFISRNLYVQSDTTSPYLDVTFDGLRILNRDIVSSKPHISIELTDDSRYLLLDDPELFTIQLKRPDGSTRDYQFDNDTLVLTPPSPADENNTASISFKPHLLEDGEYELMVSAKDQSGNSAGNISYRVAFQVLNKPMISNLLNYPNPFTTSTAFVFTLTGSEVPQNIRIQILTVTGKIVREITKAELGPLRIGRNITEFKWDGTDQYGQKLANGVYLYRVITNLNGRALDKYSAAGDNTDKYFNKGYGKMVLIR